MSKKSMVAALAVMTLIIGGVVSLFASGNPDGLEWSMEKVAGTAELAADGNIYRLAEKIQGVTSLLPDYGFRTSESAAGTSFSGIAGGITVLAVCLVICMAVRRIRRTSVKKGRE